ncbi:hypothetical protein FIBSPDRAFT_1038357 [Athelia psychrophila]|uniref:UvrD-like helicase ATP-binding domain-containing protein n=1 Tax=Athelia psychrophila TaxID=1759441 RepID=A0A166TA80_9AGAM|nr:hypothetical protein FIBSPDRAFT_1038357 [Fibularhizoctonia sp. CBS 109695]
MHPLFDLASFSPKALQHSVAQLQAIHSIESAFNEDTADEIILRLTSQPSSHSIFNRVSNHVFAYFPSTADAFDSSLGGILLRQFCTSLFSIRRALPRALELQLDDLRLPVDNAPAVLKSLSEGIDALNSQVNPRKKGKGGARFSNLDAFRKLGIFVPSTAQEAELITNQLLDEQKGILKTYFDVLQDTSHAHIFKHEYLSQFQVAPHVDVIPAEAAPEVEEPQPIEALAEQSAHPAVQPMKAALFFDSAAGFGDWRLLLSTRATKDLREARRADQALFKIIVKKMKELSNGHFSDDNQKRLNGSSSDIPIYEAKMTRDRRLVYQVDCIPEYNSDSERQGDSLSTLKVDFSQADVSQVLRLFGIYNHTQLDRLWESMGIQLARKGKEYRSRCIYRESYLPGDKVFTPGIFPPIEASEVEPTTSALDLPHEDLDALHSLLVLEKFVVFSQALLNSIIADKDVEHVFSVSPQEMAIIEHPLSCYVIGRSGTGKTTTMLFKMLGIENASAMLGDKDSSKPRQLFVTQSRVLAGKVEEYFSKLMEALATASHTPKELARLAKKIQAHREEAGLVDLDDVVNWRNDLPDRFSGLEDRHFPLFITFDRLCSLLEADSIGVKHIHSDTGDDLLNRALGEQKAGTIVSYDIFHRTYWPHFPQNLTKAFDPALVFSEIMGVIKGSEAALTSPDRFLNKQDYINLSHRTQSTFALQRETVYDIFQAYMKQKKILGHRDSADRTHAILNALSAGVVPGDRVDFIYVDEVQDNLLIDAQLLRYLCRNRDGLFWAGDTAQTISVGSSFRFNDLKAFLFRVEERNSLTSGLSAGVIHPHTFQLAVNYRSHAGIVNSAHTVIDLITSFWPHAIDSLAQETGIVDGLKPVFFHGWNADTVRYEQFLFGASGAQIEFGAQQCILVRDDSARDKLRAEVGDIGLIMTLYESKGLEFNDVLLYNFFEDSTADLSQWRVVLNTIPQVSLGAPAPRFSDARHAAICSELKFLYVAITRARKNLWVVDCSDKGEPMRMVWESKDQVQSCTPGVDVPQLAVSSSTEEWASTGKSLFQNKRYNQAMHCFERAGMVREVAVAKAYSLRERARAIPPTNHAAEDALRKTAFTDAAEAFLECAASAKIKNERRTYYGIAGDCYVVLDAYHRAADAYLAGDSFSKAAIGYRKAGSFQEAVEVIRQHRQDMDTSVANSVMDVARLHCFRNPKLIEESEILSQVKRLFEGDSKQAMTFLSDYGFDSARATLLLEAGDPVEAAKVQFEGGRLEAGITILLKSMASQACAKFAAKCTIEALWKSLSFGMVIGNVVDRKTLARWLDVAGKLECDERSILSQRDLNEIAMFKAIQAKDMKVLEQLGLQFWKAGNKEAALLCLDHIFLDPPRLHDIGIQATISALEMFFGYSTLLHDVACWKDPCGNAPIRKLFAFDELREDVFAVTPGSTLYREVANQQMFFQDKDGCRSVSRNDISRVLRRWLTERLRHRVLEENQLCKAAKFFQRPQYPCLDALLGACRMPKCQQPHIRPSDITIPWHQARVRLHLLQIQIFGTLHFVDLGPGTQREDEQRYWLDRLYAEIKPDFFFLGCRENLDLSVIRGSDRALMIVMNWVKHMIYTADAYAPIFLTNVLQAALFGLGQDPQGTLESIRQAPYLAHYFSPPPELVRKDSHAYVMQDVAWYFHRADFTFLSAGILFFRHVVTTMLPMRVTVACEMAEDLCTTCVVLMRPLHGVTLPKTWLFKVLKNGRPRGHTQLHGLLIDPILRLIGDLNTSLGPGNVSRTDHRFSTVPIAARHIYIFRLYFEAKQWFHLGYAVCDVRNDSPMDEIIQLYQENPHHHFNAPRGSRRIIFRHADDIPALLIPKKATPTDFGLSSKDVTGSVGPVLAGPPAGNQDANIMTELPLDGQQQPDPSTENKLGPVVSALADPHISTQDGDLTNAATVLSAEDHAQSGTLPETSPRMEDAELQEENEPEETDEPQMDLTVDADTLAQSMQDTGGQVLSDAPTEEQIHAALRIQTTYRQLLRYRRTSARTGLSAARNRHFVNCRLESEKMDWPRGGFCLAPPRYRIVFLGPIPHLLVCLERARTVASEDASKAKKRVAVAKHRDLEDVQAKVKAANDVVERVSRFEEALGPQGAVHRIRDHTRLKQLVNDAIVLVRKLSCADQLKDDLDLAVKAIIKQRQLPAKKPKPILNTEDDAEYDYM